MALLIKNRLQSRTAVRGSYLANKLRATGNYLRGNMGLGAAAGAFVGSGGNPMPLFAPLAGTALKKMGTAFNRRQTAKIIEMIAQRSPTMQHINRASWQTIPSRAFCLGHRRLWVFLGLRAGLNCSNHLRNNPRRSECNQCRQIWIWRPLVIHVCSQYRRT